MSTQTWLRWRLLGRSFPAYLTIGHSSESCRMSPTNAAYCCRCGLVIVTYHKESSQHRIFITQAHPRVFGIGVRGAALERSAIH